jgi:hypothetical protein
LVVSVAYIGGAGYPLSQPVLPIHGRYAAHKTSDGDKTRLYGMYM